MTTADRFVSIQPKRIMGFLDFRDRFLDYMKAQLTKIVSVAYGDDGTVGGVITISEFGSGVDRFQLDNDIVGSDGQGHFTEGDAQLSGRDVGIQFKNDNTIDYRVAYHYAERPRGIQINPRTGFPEFQEWEESLGNRDEPDLVTDNGSTITFRVNSVARLFGADSALDQTGRLCLVWKKTPGKLAITEGQAVELLPVSLVSTHNVVTSTGLFGQSAGSVSENETDYFVLLLGPSVSLANLVGEIGYHFIGTVTGQGTGVTPLFDTTGQNNLGPLISDINVISATHHGNRKIFINADNSDVDETQIEIRGRPDAASPLVFSIDEDGDMFIKGDVSTDAASKLGFGGAFDPARLLKLYGISLPSEIEGQLITGAGLTAGGIGTSEVTPRFDFGDLGTVVTYNMLFKWENSGPDRYTRFYGLSGTPGLDGFALTMNASWDESTDTWTKDTNGMAAWAISSESYVVRFKYRDPSNNGTWDDTVQPDATTGWDHAHEISGPSAANAGASLFGSLILGNDLWNTANGAVDADALVARMAINATDTTLDDSYSLLFDGTYAAGATSPWGNGRLYLTKEGGFAATVNCSWDGTDWNKDLDVFPGQPAMKAELSGQRFRLQVKQLDGGASWDDASWLDSTAFGLDNVGSAGNPRPDLAIAARLLSATLHGAASVTMATGAGFSIIDGALIADDRLVVGSQAEADADQAATDKMTIPLSATRAVTGGIATDDQSGTPANFRSYYETAGDQEWLYNAKRDIGTDVTTYVRENTSHPSIRFKLQHISATLSFLQIQVYDATAGEPWGTGSWTDLASMRLDAGLLDFGTLELYGEGQLVFQNVINPSNTIPNTGIGGNTLIGKNIPKAFLRLDIVGVTRAVLAAMNIDTITITGDVPSRMRIALKNEAAFASANDMVPFIQMMNKGIPGSGVDPEVTVINNRTIEIQFWNPSGSQLGAEAFTSEMIVWWIGAQA